MENNTENLLNKISQLFLSGEKASPDLLKAFLDLLESGQACCAKKVGDDWQVDARIKSGILLTFRTGQNQESSAGALSFVDKDLLPPRRFMIADGVRVVPGGASVRRGAHVARGVTVMAPAFVNIGAFVGEGSMVDSNALVGSCAQIGKRVHLSAGVQIGGVLEPVSSLPVIVEDDCLIGGNCGIFEGTIVGAGAVLSAGVILTQSTRVFDLVNEKILEASAGSLKIPKNAVVIPGSRGINSSFGKAHNLSISTPLIVKYRDERTEEKIRREDQLRS